MTDSCEETLSRDGDYPQRDVVKTVELFLESFSYSDVSTTIGFLSNECAWYFPGSSFFKTEYKGIKEIMTFLENLCELFPYGLVVTPEEFSNNINNVLRVRWRSSAILKSGEYHNKGTMNITFNEGGLIKQIEEYLDTAKLCRLFHQVY